MGDDGDVRRAHHADVVAVNGDEVRLGEQVPCGVGPSSEGVDGVMVSGAHALEEVQGRGCEARCVVVAAAPRHIVAEEADHVLLEALD